jgi:tetratricopeptide (TPR) repeat protein
MALHRAGRLADAELVFADVLRVNPTDFEVLHLQGVIAHETGRHVRAVELIGSAIALRATPAAHLSLGGALMALGRYAEAVASYEAALSLQPHLAEAYNNRGIALQQLQRSVEALESFDRALALQPESAEFHNNRGNVLRHLDRAREALVSYERALTLQPDFAAALNNRGIVLQALLRFREAAGSYERALALKPNFAEAHNNLGTVQCELGQPAAALASCSRALKLQPQMLGVHANLGNALRDLERPEEALAHFELALREEPGSAVHACNRANALFDLKLLTDAIAGYDRAIQLDPRYAQAYFNKSVCLLLSGDFARGLPLYEWRKELKGTAVPPGSGPMWRGDQEISGKTLLIYADQALGDTLHICRYVRVAEERGARVVLAVQPRLRELLRGLSATARILAPGEQPDGFDYRCAMMSLPLAFGTSVPTIPACVPYLFADPLRAAHWRRRLGDEGFKVGVVWQGSRNRIDVGRSVPPAVFAPLATIPGVRLISLQKGERPGQPPVEILGEDFDAGSQAFLDSAAVMTHLDLVITCDTALAHLAGALGRPTWVVLKHVPEWRWLLDRTDSPWYPSMRLFRQSRRGDWEGVFAEIHHELAHLAQAMR